MALYVINSLDGFGAFTATVSETNGIDAGAFVKCVSSVEATATSTVVDKILVSLADAAGDENTVVGIALEDGDNGELVSVATRGLFRCPVDVANGSVVTGAPVQVSDQTDTTACEIELYDASDASVKPIGQALTGCNADNEFVVVRMDMGNGVGSL